MIISASRRTEIPGYYGKWFMNRVREGYCEVSNPYNPALLSRVSLLSTDVDLFVFWTRNTAPFMGYLPELNERGFNYYFLYTLVHYPIYFEPRSEALEKKLETFMALSDTIGPEKVIWRYDPILLSSVTGYDYHLKLFRKIAGRLSGYTSRVIISFVDLYKKVKERLSGKGEMDPRIIHPAEEMNSPCFSDMMKGIREAAGTAGMEIQSCAEKIDLSRWDISRGKCIDDGLIRRVFGLTPSSQKDKGQRKLCGCIPSRDIGAYNTCPRGCVYCYACKSPANAIDQHRAHDSERSYL